LAEVALSKPGTVYLVGAGPGDPGLITVRGVEVLRRADVVVYDSLANERLVDLAPASAERIAVGKRHGTTCMSQEAINELLVARAAAGLAVVRLKGGDPFVFGRGGEEAAALRAHDIRFEIVPGVTAGVAAPACAGIPVTHRDYASAVAFVTGHEDACKPGGTIDWSALARFPGTLVFYMSVSRLTDLTATLIAHGMSPDTPAAAIERGTTPAQRSVRGSLADIARRVRDIGLSPPAVIVVGRVASLGDALRWFDDRPLFGQRIIVTRPVRQAAAMVERLESLGAEVLELPALVIEPPADWSRVDQTIAALDQYGWIVFTSANGVNFFFDRLFAAGRDVRALGRAKLAAIGTATARELERWRVRADLAPDEANSESLVAALVESCSSIAASVSAQVRESLLPLPAAGRGRSVDTNSSVVRGDADRATVRRVLLLRAEQGREALPDGLRSAGVAFDEVAVYRALDQTEWPPAIVERLGRGEVDWITVTSPRTVRCLATHLPQAARERLGTRPKLASISPLTSAAAREHGLTVTVEAATASTDDLVDAIVQWVSEHGHRSGS
jgi:uroporphyrinogen III methyltransferase/synthase